jgi:hypothetical protein
MCFNYFLHGNNVLGNLFDMKISRRLNDIVWLVNMNIEEQFYGCE